MEQRVSIRSRTCIRDINGLYDFEALCILISDLSVLSPCSITRYNSSVSAQAEILVGQRQLFNIEMTESQFYVPLEKDLWVIVNDQCKLTEDDVIKLGRAEFKVIEISHANNQTLADDEEEPTVSSCRICLENFSSLENPLVNLCNCSGSVKDIHLKCLHSWLNTKMTVKENESFCVWHWKSLECELCKATYPRKFQYRGLQYDVLALSGLKLPYILLGNSDLGFIAFSLAENSKATIGNNELSDVVVDEVSLSKVHSSIECKNGAFYIRDLNSRFGSFIKPKGYLPISSEPLHLQLDRSIFTIKLVE